MKTEIRYTKEYLLLIDEESKGIEFGEIGVNMRHSELEVETRNMGGYGSDKYYWSHKKCLAYYPLIKEAKELDLPLLPNPFKEEFNNINELAIKHWGSRTYEDMDICCDNFIAGYNAAQSKQFSLEDMKKALSEAFKASQEGYQITADEIIKSLSTQQLPKEFIPEVVTVTRGTNEFDFYEEDVIKTITNSEGREEVKGKWIY